MAAPKTATRGAAVRGLREIPAGSGNWFWYPYDKTRQPTRKSVARRSITADAAVGEAAVLRESWVRGEFDPWTDPHEPGKTLAEYADDFLSAFSAQAENTTASKRSTLKGFLLSCPAKVPSGVTARHIETFSTALPNESTRKVRFSVLRQFFDFLVDRRVITDNVARSAARAYRQRMSKASRNEGSRRRDRFFTPADVARMSEAARSERFGPTHTDLGYLASVMEFAACTGLRRGELVHLGWGDVRMVDVARPEGVAPIRGGIVTVRCWDSGAETFATKTGRDRIVPLSPRAAQALADAEADRVSDDPFEPVFKRATNNGRVRVADLGWARRRLPTTAFNDHFDTVRAACGLASPANSVRRTGDAVFHTFRHSFVSWMVMLGVPPELLRRWTGHAATDVFSGYVHMTEGYLAGRTREVQRDVASYLCPGADPAAVSVVFPEAAAAMTWAAGGVLRPHVPAEEAVFGGLLYAASPPAEALPTRYAQPVSS